MHLPTRLTLLALLPALILPSLALPAHSLPKPATVKPLAQPPGTGIAAKPLAQPPGTGIAAKPTTAKPIAPDFTGTGRPSNRGRAGSRTSCQSADIPFVLIDDDRSSITTQTQPSFLVYLPSTASRFTEIRASLTSRDSRDEIALPVPTDRSRIVRLTPQIKRPLQINQTYNWKLAFYCGQTSNQASSQPNSQPTLTASLPTRSIGQSISSRPQPQKQPPAQPAKRPSPSQSMAPIAAAPESQAIVLEGTIQRRLPSPALRNALNVAKTDRDRYQAYATHGSWLDTINAIQPLRCIATPDPALEQSWQQLLDREKLSDFAAFPAGQCKVLGGKTSP